MLVEPIRLKGENLPNYKTSASNRWASTFEDANTKNAKNAKNAKSQELYHNGREQKGGAAVVPPWGSSIFLVQEARGPELGTTGRPAPRAEVALL